VRLKDNAVFRMKFVRTWKNLLLRPFILFLLVFMGCGQPLERPFGVVRVGELKSFPVGKTRYFEEYSLLVQRDSDGIRAMSTLNPATFSPLDKTIIDDHVLFRDPTNGSLFDQSGRLQNVQGVNKEKGTLPSSVRMGSLTHYRVLFDRVATDLEVQVIIGDVRPSDWRLKIPA